MKALIDVANSKILTVTDASDFGGPWGEMLKSGAAVLVSLPAGEAVEDLSVSGAVVSVAPVKKAARLAKEQARIDRRARLKSHDSNNSGNPAQLKAMVKDLLDEVNGA